MTKAEVRVAMGRFFLRVSGVIVAVEGDPCRDPRFPDVVWTRAALNEAARIINGPGSNGQDPIIDPRD